MTRCVSGPSRKATPSLICLAEASRPDLASPTYLRPSRVPLWSPFTISSRNAFYYLTTRLVTPASPLRPASSSRHSCILRHPAFSCVILHSPVSSCVLLGHPVFSYVILRSPASSCVLLHSPAFTLRSPASSCVCVLRPLRSHRL